MSFHDIRFPTKISYGASGGPERRTDIVSLTSGHEERNSPWAHSRRKFDAGLGMCSLDDMASVIAFFEARHGQLYGFRWKDWADYKSCFPSADPAPTDMEIGVGDGASTEFQLKKSYASGPATYVRPVTHPVAGTVRIAIDGIELGEGVDFAVSFETGVVTLVSVPATGALVTAGFEFDVPVRFATDHITANLASFQAGEVPEVPVVELRV